MSVLDPLAHDERTNAAVGWVLVGVALAATVESGLTGALLWSLLALAFAVAVATPALLVRDATTIVPWPLVFVGAAAVAVRAAGYYPETTGLVAVAALALVGVVELDVFTEVDMTRRFTVGFAVLATMAAQALWSVAEFYSDTWLGTEFLSSQRELQWDLVAVTVVALVMGLFFNWYLHRIGYAGSRSQVPGEVGST